MKVHYSVPMFCLLVGTLPTAACNAGNDSENGPRWTAAIDTVADTVVVRTVSGKVWNSDRTLVSEVSIGVLEGEDEYQFGNRRAIAVDREGRMYAFDAHVPALRLYGPDGAWLRDIGGEGEGPGEYKRPDSGLAILPDGRVGVQEARFRPGHTAGRPGGDA